MSRVKWRREECEAGTGYWHEYGLSDGMRYAVDVYPGHYTAQFVQPDHDTRIGPDRKTLRAAHNDCKRHAKKLRAALVEFDRCKL